jgi:hypothetical protein
MVFIDLILALFVATAVSYVFFYFIMPRPSAILKELAGNRLRIEFVAPPAPTTPLQKIWANILVRPAASPHLTSVPSRRTNRE